MIPDWKLNIWLTVNIIGVVFALFWFIPEMVRLSELHTARPATIFSTFALLAACGSAAWLNERIREIKKDKH